jgi:predicted alpha/beta-hydrolase family hydrolase
MKISMSDLRFDGPENAKKTVVLAHGAGASMDSEFLKVFAEGLAANGLRVARFEFPYMAKRRIDGKRRPPDRMDVLLAAYRHIVCATQAETLIVGGKSMGGRVASMIADDLEAAGLVCLGYPFHPPGKPEKLRTQHLQNLITPSLFLQGERDPLGTPGEIENYGLSHSITIKYLPDGDHDLKPRKASGRTRDENWREAIRHMAEFAERL